MKNKIILKRLSLMFIILMIMNFILANVCAVEYNPSTDVISIEKEAILSYASENENIANALKALPDHFEFDPVTYDEAKVIEQGDFFVYLYTLYDNIYEIVAPIMESYGFTENDYFIDVLDIHTCTVSIIKNNDYDTILGEKEIKINYTGNYNEQDEKYVKNIINNLDTNIIFSHDITKEYTDEEYTKAENEFPAIIKDRIDDNSIDVIAQYGSCGGGGFGDIGVISSYVYLFKNNILYDMIYTDSYTINTVFLPNEVNDTNEDYINYALPLLKDFYNGNFETDRVEKMTEEYIIEEDDWCTLKNNGSFYKVYFKGEDDEWARFMIVKENKSNILKGDLDRNGVVNSNDAAIALDIYNGRKMEDNDLKIADMDNNGVINSTDAAMILDVYNAQ